MNQHIKRSFLYLRKNKWQYFKKYTILEALYFRIIQVSQSSKELVFYTLYSYTVLYNWFQIAEASVSLNKQDLCSKFHKFWIFKHLVKKVYF